MGWSGGSNMAEEIWLTLRPKIAVKNRKFCAQQLIRLFEDEDCDTIDEAEQLCEDAGYDPFDVNDDYFDSDDEFA